MDQTPDKILAVVISFNGGNKLMSTLNALRGQVDHVHIVDNASDALTSSILSALDHSRDVSITRFPENLGIGVALNLGVAFARERGYGWVLTMDQDSCADPGMLDAFRSTIKAQPEHRCLTPTLVVNGVSGVGEDREVAYAITSGNLVSMDVYDKIGGYNTDMFIDCVDFDFCLRARSIGFHIYRVKDAKLNHELGEPHHQTGILSRFYTQHSPLRRYYMYRNFLLLWKLHFRKFPEFFLKSAIVHLLYIFAIIKYDKIISKNIWAIISGIIDFSRGKLGKRSPYF